MMSLNEPKIYTKWISVDAFIPQKPQWLLVITP